MKKKSMFPATIYIRLFLFIKTGSVLLVKTQDITANLKTSVVLYHPQGP